MASVLLIYTGGTIGMMEDPISGSLVPVDFSLLDKHIPEVNQFDLDIGFEAFDEPIDSSFIQPKHWVLLAEIIERNYEKYDGFVVLHGTDTLAYTASALSYMLQNLRKPVILTGAQLPIGRLRTDGKENLITSIEIAASCTSSGDPVVQEVAICFEDRLLRGNRSHKHSTEDFDAFHSYNYPNLANIGIHIQFNKEALLRPNDDQPFTVNKKLSAEVALLSLYPGMPQAAVEGVLNSGVRALVIEAFGSGNAPNDKWFYDGLRQFRDAGGLVVCVTQCQNGFVELGRYGASASLVDVGALSAGDMTTESVLAKMMCLLGQSDNNEEVGAMFSRPVSGDFTTYSERL